MSPKRCVIQKPQREPLLDPRKKHRNLHTVQKHVALFEHPTLDDRVRFGQYDTEDELLKLRATSGEGPWYKMTYEQALQIDCISLNDLYAGIGLREIPPQTTSTK